MNADDSVLLVGYARASYRDGKLVAKKAGESKDPKPCAGKNGTQILVSEDD